MEQHTLTEKMQEHYAKEAFKAFLYRNQRLVRWNRFGKPVEAQVNPKRNMITVATLDHVYYVTIKDNWV